LFGNFENPIAAARILKNTKMLTIVYDNFENPIAAAWILKRLRC